jgi:DNA primase
VLAAPLRAGADPATLLQREGAGAARQLVADAIGFARFRVHHHLARADLGTAEGKDRLVSELRDVFADIPSSAVREDLIELVAARAGLQRALVSSWLPTCEAASRQRPTSIAPDAVAPEGGPGRGLLVRCVADPEAAAALPTGSALAELFPDALPRRAAEHIRVHAQDPATDLPDDDHELVAFITGLLTAPAGTISDPCR